MECQECKKDLNLAKLENYLKKRFIILCPVFFSEKEKLWKLWNYSFSFNWKKWENWWE